MSQHPAIEKTQALEGLDGVLFGIHMHVDLLKLCAFIVTQAA